MGDYDEPLESDNINERFVAIDDGVKKVNRDHIASHLGSLNIGGYAGARIEKSDSEIRFPVKILKVIKDVNDRYERKTLLSELTLVALELCLNVPRQMKMKVEGYTLDMNTEVTIIYEDKSFCNAIEIIKDLLKAGTLVEEDVRPEVLEIIRKIALRS